MVQLLGMVEGTIARPAGEPQGLSERARVACGDRRDGVVRLLPPAARNEVDERGAKVGARKEDEVIDKALDEELSLHAMRRMSWSAARSRATSYWGSPQRATHPPACSAHAPVPATTML